MSAGIECQASACKSASRMLANAPAEQRSSALRFMAEELRNSENEILKANSLDAERAKKLDLEKKRIAILTIDSSDISSMADFFETVASYEDIAGKELTRIEKEDGCVISKRLVPLGVLFMISEARPSVLCDTSAICLRSGNALLFQSSANSANTDCAVAASLRRAMKRAQLPEDCITILSDTSHEAAYRISQLANQIDLVCVRGGYGALADIKKNAIVPVIGAGPGNCHVYVEKSAKPEMARDIVLNSKVPRPLACNAAETLLLDRGLSSKVISMLLDSLYEAGITLHGSEELSSVFSYILPANEKDYLYEYFAPEMAVALVSDIEEAVAHINRCRTPHTEVIVTEDESAAKFFTENVEANSVGVNASTRLTDGMFFELGGEIGISTQKYPFGGPIGIRHLMQEKYFVFGKGTLRK